MLPILTIDGFCEDPFLEREKALAATYKTISMPNYTVHGINLCEDKENETKIIDMLGEDLELNFSVYRRYYRNEAVPTYIHSDVDVGLYTAILFLNLPSQCTGGTAFWKYKKYGWEKSPETTGQIEDVGEKDTPEFWHKMHLDGFDESQWEMTQLVEMKFNRLFVFPSAGYHSRYPQDSFGTDIHNARLIKSFFLVKRGNRNKNLRA